MKINIIIPGVGLSGGIRVLFKYAELLKEKGHDVVFYTPIKAYDVKNNKSDLLNKGHVVTNSLKRVNAYCFKKNQNKTGFDVTVKAIPFIADKFIRDGDVLLATAWPTAYSVAKLDENKGKKVYFVQDYEIWNNEKLGKKSYTLPLKKITISTWIKSKLIEQLHTTDIPIVYDGLDIDVFHNKKTEYYNGKNELKILMLYHNLSKKGVEDGLLAYDMLKAKNLNVKLSMFGLDRNPKIPSDVTYYCDPTREKLKKLYNESDVFLYTSREEGWGLTPLEAMASGCVVVGTNTGCMLDIGVNGENVLLSEPNEPVGLYENIEKIIKNPDLVQRLAINGFETVRQFSWKNAVNNFELVLKEVKNEDKK